MVPWCILTGSNRRPSPCKGAALPTELRMRGFRAATLVLFCRARMEETVGFEPTDPVIPSLLLSREVPSATRPRLHIFYLALLERFELPTSRFVALRSDPSELQRVWFGSPGAGRTRDLRLRRPTLCPLSYGRNVDGCAFQPVAPSIGLCGWKTMDVGGSERIRTSVAFRPICFRGSANRPALARFLVYPDRSSRLPALIFDSLPLRPVR